jgi:hypothetical protein
MLEDLAKTLHRKRGQILKQLMQWGIPHSGGWSIDQSIPAAPHLVEHFDKPRAEVIRQLITQARPEDFPQSWQLAANERR